MTTASRPCKATNLSDLIGNFHQAIDNLRREHENELDEFRRRIEILENENERLRANARRPSSNVDVEQLNAAREEIQRLNKALQEQSDEADRREKDGLRRILGKSNDELPTKLEQIRSQFHQFDQCHYETDEQIRLLRQCLFNSNEQPANIAQTSTVKQSDLIQQTNLVENLLQKHEEKILQRLNEWLNGNSSSSTSSSSMQKSKKKKRC